MSHRIRKDFRKKIIDTVEVLHNNPQHNTAAEIVKVRKLTKSHVSTSLKKLENKELVERK